MKLRDIFVAFILSAILLVLSVFAQGFPLRFLEPVLCIQLVGASCPRFRIIWTAVFADFAFWFALVLGILGVGGLLRQGLKWVLAALAGLVIVGLLGYWYISHQETTTTPSQTQRAEVVATHCADPNVASVHSCDGGVLKIVSKLLGGGVSFIKKDETKVSCPVVAPQYITAECKRLDGLSCSENFCQNSTTAP